MDKALPPLHLRPCKFVDRMMFVDLIGRTLGEQGAQNYCYISMGATFLPDHHVVYRRLGIEQLISFGNDADDVKRQEFNRPTDRMKCEQMHSRDLAARLDDLRGTTSIVLWLDYMYPEERRGQVQEVEVILEKLKPGDILKVTMNAEYRTFGPFGDAEKDLYADLETMAAAKLRDQLGEYLPAKLTTLSEADFPKVLAGTIQLAAERVTRHRRDIDIVPIILTSYADGQRMVTVACVIRPANDSSLPPSIREWEHRSKDWQDVKLIDVPDLSLREKYYIDQNLQKTSENILNALPFKPAETIAADELHRAIESYKLFHRYYPGFQHVDA